MMLMIMPRIRAQAMVVIVTLPIVIAMPPIPGMRIADPVKRLA